MRASIFSRRKSKPPIKETNPDSEGKTKKEPTLGPLHSIHQLAGLPGTSGSSNGNRDENLKVKADKGYDVGVSHPRDGEYYTSGTAIQRLRVGSPTNGSGSGNGLATHNERSTSASGSFSGMGMGMGMGMGTGSGTGIPGFRSRSVSPSKSQQSRQSRQSRVPSAQGHGNGNAILSHAFPQYASASNSHTSLTESTAYLPLQQSWTNMAEDDLINNLGPRERTRQEVLWEIVSSEDRYVQDLIKLVDTFAHALLPSSAMSPSLSLDDPITTLLRARQYDSHTPTSPTTPSEQSPTLPIAAHFSRLGMGSGSAPGSADTARSDAYQKLTNGSAPGGLRYDQRGPSNSSATSIHSKGHRQSLPPPTHRQPSFSGGSTRASISGKSRSRLTSSSSIASMRADVELPDDLKTVLSVVAGGILEGHLKLAAALRKRYEDQYPLVRSLADVFTAHSYILREYATFVCHLERALEQVDSALSLATTSTRRYSYTRNKDQAQLQLGRTLVSLDELASQRGESCLSISLSKPFQRLLKYPLMFQNLLFNTDPSLREYEATLAMVDDVEAIVRGIEDEKTGQEERERTRDAWARIEGVDKDKALMAPKPSRVLVSETQAGPAMMSQEEKQATKSRHRLSDILKRHDHGEFWVVKFNDVTLLCEKTGSTELPVASLNRGGEEGGKAKKRQSRRAQSVKSRNMYKLSRVLEWHDKASKETIKSAESDSAPGSYRHSSASRSTLPRVTQSPPATPRKRPQPSSNTSSPSRPTSQVMARIPLKTNDGPSPARTIRPTQADTQTIASDRLSVMSFAFKGGDQLKPRSRLSGSTAPRSVQAAVAGHPSPGSTFSPPRAVSGIPPPTPTDRDQRRASGGHMQGKAATAKFAHRLRPDAYGADGHAHTIRPASTTRQSLPPSMARPALTGQGDVNRPLSGVKEGGERGRDDVKTTVPVQSRLTAPTAASEARAKAAQAQAQAQGLVNRQGSVSSRRTQPRARVNFI